jgi:TBC1 domain family member 15
LRTKNEIIANNFGFNEILKFVNELSLKIDLDKTLETAEGLFLQLNNFKNLPNEICEILHFPAKVEHHNDFK